MDTYNNSSSAGVPAPSNFKGKIIPFNSSTETFEEDEDSLSDEEKMQKLVSDILDDLPDGMAPFSDVCNAHIFAVVYFGTVAYCPEEKTYLFFDGVKWCRDDENWTQTRQYAARVAEMIYTAASGYTEKDRRLAAKLQNTGKINAMLLMAETNLCVSKESFDRNPMLINVKNGTIELLPTGYRFREHRAEDYITLCADVDYKPIAKSPVFDEFLHSIMCVDAPTETISDAEAETNDRADYLQRIIGYSLSGKKDEDCFFVFYGNGRNGKGVFVDTMETLFGDYATCASPKTITAGQSARAGAPSEDLAALCGRRFITVSETEKGMTLNEALLKAATGRDKITARYLYKGLFCFRMEGTIIINTNHLPVVSDPTIFATGRTILLHFAHTFSEAEQDKSLREKLTTKGTKSAILSWALEGYNKQLTQSVKNMPQSSRDAINAYWKMTENVGEYAEKELSKTGDVMSYVTTSEAYKDYVEWCRYKSYHSESTEDFKKALTEQGMKIKRMTRKGCGKETVIFGFTLTTE